MVVAHPGHELRVFGWMAKSAPLVHILTDGSGASASPRIASSRSLFDEVGATPGEIFPAGSDGDLYRALLNGDYAFFFDIMERLTRSFVDHDIHEVAADAAEGFNPAHDLCRGLVNAAVSMARARTGRAIANYQFSLAEWIDERQAPYDEHCRHLTLSESLFKTKLTIARNYPGLHREVDDALAAFGEEYFRREYLRPDENLLHVPGTGPKPYYEIIGERRVATGTYGSTLRYADHVFPVLDALHRQALMCAPQSAGAAVADRRVTLART